MINKDVWKKRLEELIQMEKDAIDREIISETIYQEYYDIDRLNKKKKLTEGEMAELSELEYKQELRIQRVRVLLGKEIEAMLRLEEKKYGGKGLTKEEEGEYDYHIEEKRRYLKMLRETGNV